jgi:sugar lactone lactonase YvrE
LPPRGAFHPQSFFGLRTLSSLCAAALFFACNGCGNAGNLAGPLAINSFMATPATIGAGQSTTLSWSVTVAAAKLSISDGSSSQNATGLTPFSGNSVTVTPAATTTYTLTATDRSGNTDTQTATVTVVPLPAIASFTASPAIISDNGGSTLNWNVSNAATVSIECISVGCQFENSPVNTYVPVTGNSVVVNPTTPTTYQLTAYDAAGDTANAQVTVNVVLAPIIKSFTASPATIGAGQSSTLAWSVSGATTISINNGIGTVTGSSIQVSPSQTTIYKLTAIATDSTGVFQVLSTAQATVSVSLTPPPQITSFIATPASVGPGGDVTLTPVFTPVNSSTTATLSQCTDTVANCSGPKAVFVSLGSVTSGEVIQANPTASTTYTLTVTNTNPQPAVASVRVLAGDVAVLAGSPTNHGYQNGLKQAAMFDQPNGIAADSFGNLYVADTANNLIRMITPAGEVSTFAGDTANGLGFPGVTGSNDGPTQCGTSKPCAEFNGPIGIAVDAGNNVWVSDSGNNTIREISGGMVTTVAGIVGPGGYQNGPVATAAFFSPEGMAFDAQGNLYIADSSNCAIREITGIGTASTAVSTLAGPSGLGQCSYADGGINGSGVSLARFNNPTGLAVDSNGNVYVADENNDVIRLIAPGGNVSTVAGLANAAGSKDGTGTLARFNHPTSVALDGQGNIYVADSENYTIRRISPSPSPTPDGSNVNVITVIGQAGNPNAALTGGPLPSMIAAPNQIAIDPTSGNQFITMNVQAIVSAPY